MRLLGVKQRIANGTVVTAGPPPRRMSMWSVVQRGDELWTQVTGTPSTVDRAVIEASAREHGYMGDHRVYPNVRLVIPR